MSDFEPVFRDGIGYCNVACKFGHIHSHEGQTVVCLHLDNDTVCIPWVRSLLSPPPDEKVREAVEWLESEVYGVPGLTEVWSEKIRTVIDAYRARNPKGTPMSTDNVIYVQRRNAESSSINVPPVYYWYTWADSTSNESPIPHSPRQRSTRESALAAAHDLAAEIGIPNVQELPPQEWSSKTQAQQDAEWLRELVNRQYDKGRPLFCEDGDHMRKIADRLEST